METIKLDYFLGKLLPDTTSYELLSYTTDRWTMIDHQKIAKYIIEKYILASSDGNIFRYGEWIWEAISHIMVENTIIEVIEKFFVQNDLIKKIKKSDVNQILDFLIVIAENKDLKNALKRKKNDTEKYENHINYYEWTINHRNGNVDLYSPKVFRFSKLPRSAMDILSDEEKNIYSKRYAFLDEILEWYNDKESIKNFLQEYFWLLLTNSVKFERWLLLYGSWANGKWVLLHIIEKMVWPENVSHVWMHELNKEQTLYNLFWKMVNLDCDMQQSVQLDSSIIKKIISSETITWKLLYVNPLEFNPTCKLVIATNELPRVTTPDFSISRRFVILHLKKSFFGKENRNLKYELEKELPEIITWSIEGLERLLKRWEFLIPEELRAIWEQFILDYDSVKQFLNDGQQYICQGDDERIPHAQLYTLYKKFCRDTWIPTANSSRELNKRIRELWFKELRKHYARWFKWIWVVWKTKMTKWQDDNLFWNISENEW